MRPRQSSYPAKVEVAIGQAWLSLDPPQEGKFVMRSLISSVNLVKGSFRLGRALPRYLSACLLTLALLIATEGAAHGQSVNSANASKEETAREVVISSDQVSDSSPALVTDPATILRNAKLIYIRKKSVYFKAPELENELRKRPEFQRWGLAITRNEADADLIIEVGRKVFTTRFIYTVIDPRTDIVVTSGKLSSLGGTLATKIAKRFIEQMQRVRQ